MPSQPPIPPLLSPYLSNSAHSPHSLTLITSVLAATSNWLALRYLYSVLSISHLSHSSDEHDGQHTGKARRIVLVSFLRDWSFWKAEGKRLGLDLQRFVDGDKFKYVDGLSGLFGMGGGQQQQQQQQQPGPIRTSQTGIMAGSGRPIPMRGPAESVTARGPTLPSQTSLSNVNHSTSTTDNNSSAQRPLHISGQGIAVLNALERDVISVITSLKKSNNISEDEDGDNILLILDQPDFVLASTTGIDANDMSEWIMGLQQQVRSTVVTTSADYPLIHKANPVPSGHGEGTISTSLEKNHAAFVVGLAHRATMVLQLRTLDTGAAKDVSGVLRISRGGGFDNRTDNVDDNEGGHVEKEVLYFVQRDGGVRAFGRGEV